MKFCSHKNNRKKVQRSLSVLLVLCLAFSEGSQQIAIAGAANGGEEYHQHDDGCYEKVLVCGMEERIGESPEKKTESALEETDVNPHGADS